MPIHERKNNDDYTRVKRVYTNSGDDRVTEEANNTFRIQLDEEVRDVVGVELTGFSVPNNAAPSFVAERNNRPGDNKIDFYIIDLNAGPGYGTTSIITFEMPEVRYEYENNDDVTLSYVSVLRERMQAAIIADPYFGSILNTALSVFSDDLGRTDLQIRDGADLYDWGFLFATGPNADKAPYKQMGFEKLDYTTSRRLTSPYRVNLRLYRYIDIKIDEVRELGSVGRIFIEEDNEKFYVSNERNTARTRMISSDRLHRLRQLTITPTLNGGMHIPSGIELDLELSIFHLSNQGTKPRWFKERLTL